MNPLSLDDQSFEVLVVGPYEEAITDSELAEHRKKSIAAKIGNLPDRQREVINLLFYENLGYEEIAEMMGINLRSVYTLAWKAISALRKNLIDLSVLIPLLIFLYQ